MAHWIIGADSANGEQKFSAVKLKGDGTPGKRKDIRFPSVRANVSVGTLGLEGAGETEFDFWRWHNITYTAGDTALEYARGAVMPVQGRTRYGGEAQLFMVAVALYELGLKDGDTFDICLLAPPGDASAATGDKYRAGFDAFDCKLTVSQNGGKARTFTANSVTVFAETVAASIAAAYDDTGTRQKQTPKTNTLMLVDGGRVTLDRLVFRRGKIDKSTIDDATNDRLGIGAMVLEPAAKWVRSKYDTIYHDGAEELVDRALRNPKVNDGSKIYWLSRAGEPPVNITAPMQQFVANYHSSVRTYLDAQRRTWNVDRALLIGGVEPLIGADLRADFDGVFEFMRLADYGHLKDVPANHMNSVGALRYLLKKLAT